MGRSVQEESQSVHLMGSASVDPIPKRVGGAYIGEAGCLAGGSGTEKFRLAAPQGNWAVYTWTAVGRVRSGERVPMLAWAETKGEAWIHFIGGADASPAPEACGGRSVSRSQQPCLRGRGLVAQGNRRSRGPGSPPLCTSVTATRLMGQSFSCLDGYRIVAIHLSCAFHLLTVLCSPPRPGSAAVT